MGYTIFHSPQVLRLVPIAFLLGTLSTPLSARAFPDPPAGQSLSTLPTTSPHNGLTSQSKAAFYFALGMEHLNAGRFEQALEAFREGAASDEQAASFNLYRGYALFRLGEIGAAEDALAEALRREEDRRGALRLLGHIHFETGRNYSAAEFWRQALAIRGDDPELEQWLAKVERDLQTEEGMDNSYGSSFIVSYDGEAAPELGDRVLDVLEDALLDVGALFNAYPRAQIPVVLYTREVFSAVTGSPDWAGGLYDGRIRLPIGGIENVGPKVRALVFHEYTHALVHQVTRGHCPLWLNEGLAEWAGRQQHDSGMSHLKDAEAIGGLFDLDQLGTSWERLKGERVQLAYEQSYAFVDYLLREYGWNDMMSLLHLLGQGRHLAFDEAFGRVYGMYGESLNSLQKRWRGDLARSLAKTG